MSDLPTPEIRIRWTGTAKADTREAVYWLNRVPAFIEENPDRKPGWRHGWFCANTTRQVHVYRTAARVVVVRIHGVTNAD